MNLQKSSLKRIEGLSDYRAYVQIVILSLLAHISFTVIFALIPVYSIMKYNIFSIVFYLVMLYLLYKKCAAAVVVLIHIEICVFVSVATLGLGWEYGFAFYLIALCALVYFCPFRNIYIPYYFSIIEMILFIGLKLYTSTHPAMIHTTVSPNTPDIIYSYNAVTGFAVILYSAFISRLSSVFTERKLTAQNNDLKEIVNHDTLTQLHSRAFIMEQFDLIQINKKEVHVVMADIDNFKQINDTYGHLCGDYVLSTLSTIMKTLCPSGSHIGRWGGEEFILLFYHLSKEEAIGHLNKLRDTINLYDFQYQDVSLKLTVTFGLSSSTEGSSADELIKLADERLYYGKRNGKNQIVS